MNKLGKKLFLSISLTVILIFTISLLLINYLLPKYNIYKTRESLKGITAQIQSIPSEQIDEAISSIENKGTVTIAYTSINNSEDHINDELRLQLTRKRVALNKLWITKGEIIKVKNFGQLNKIYDQEKTKSSFL